MPETLSKPGAPPSTTAELLTLNRVASDPQIQAVAPGACVVAEQGPNHPNPNQLFDRGLELVMRLSSTPADDPNFRLLKNELMEMSRRGAILEATVPKWLMAFEFARLARFFCEGDRLLAAIREACARPDLTIPEAINLHRLINAEVDKIQNGIARERAREKRVKTRTRKRNTFEAGQNW